MKLHKLARLFPKVTGPDFKALVLDIKTNGLRQPITTLGGAILDGQNRHAACIAAGVTPEFTAFVGDDPLAFVISQNMNRRHLTDSQRAAIAADLSKAKRGKSANSEDLDSAEAAAALKVTRRQVERAKQVKKESPKSFKEVKSGKKSLNAAHEEKHPRKKPATVDTRGGLAAQMREPTPEEADLGVLSTAMVINHGLTHMAESLAPALADLSRTAKELLAEDEPSNIHMMHGIILELFTPKEFDISLTQFEDAINLRCAGVQKERERYGVLANALAWRLMNPPVKDKDYNPYGR